MFSIRPKYCFGIYISCHQLVGVVAEQNDECINAVNVYRVEDTQDMFSEHNHEQLRNALIQVLDEFNTKYKGQYIPLQISLADPLVKSAVFDLEAMPTQAKARDQLVRRRFDKEHHIDMEQMSLTLQPMVSKQGKQQIYALTTGSSVIQIISDVCKQKQLMLNALDGSVNYLFNNYYESMVESAGLLQLNPEYWTLIAWDKEKHIRYVRSKWFCRNGVKRDEELKVILLDVERLLHSFNEVNEDSPSVLYIEPSIHDRQLLQEVLPQRLENNFTFLEQKNTMAADGGNDVYAMAAMAARYR